MMVFVVYHLFDLGFELSELDVVGSLNSKNGSAQNKQFADDGNR